MRKFTQFLFGGGEVTVRKKTIFPIVVVFCDGDCASKNTIRTPLLLKPFLQKNLTFFFPPHDSHLSYR